MGRRVGAASSMAILFFGVGLAISSLLRLARLFPNNDPIMAVMLPYAKRGSRWMAMAFPLLAMVVFDLLSGRIGVWTAVTAGTYGVLGWAFSTMYPRLVARGRRIGSLSYLVSGVAGVIVFDFVTGPIMSSILFGLTFEQALHGQIPFTLRHLASASAYTVIICPLLERALAWMARCEPRVRRLMGLETGASPSTV